MLYIDQLNRKIEFQHPPRRIISLVPSQTELLFDLGLRDEVIGITKFCKYPEQWFESKTKIGGTKNINIEKIKTLQPDLIIGNKEENEKDQIEELTKYYPVWISDVKNLKDAYNLITNLGTIIGKQEEATLLKLMIESKFNTFIQHRKTIDNNRVVYFIWKDPYMTAGKNTFINTMIETCGLVNVLNVSEGHYPALDMNTLKTLHPNVIFLSSEPYPFKEVHLNEFQQACPNAKVMLVNGEMFSWYGSRLLHAPDYFNQLIKAICV